MESEKPHEAIEITPAYCCYTYFSAIFYLLLLSLLFSGFGALDSANFCYLDLFVNSVSVSNAASNVSNADWRIGFVARSPVTGCEITLRPIESRLLRGDQVIDSPYIGQTVVDGDKINYGFETAAMLMPEAVNGGVIWDFRFEIVAGVKKRDYYRDKGILMVNCGDIPVKFTTDPAGNVMGSLLGYMKRCDYLFQLPI